MVFLKKENLVFLGLLGIIVVIACCCGVLAFQKEEQEVILSDAKKIQEEYAKYNNETNESANRTYPLVELNENNPFVYKSEEEIIEILEGKTGLIYFGFPECPWCRSILPVLEEAAIENKVAEIAYLNIENIRDVLELDENEKIVTTKEGSNNYYRILKLLDDYLEEYTLTDEEGNEIKTGEKRLYAPTVVAVSNGKIVGFHSGSIETQKNGYEPLTAKEKEELKKIYTDMIEKMSEGTCNEGC